MNGSHLEMPGTGKSGMRDIVRAVKDGTLPEEVLDQRLDELLNVVFATHQATVDGKEKKFENASDARTAYVEDQKKIASKAISEDFQKYVQTTDTEATTGATGETRYGARVDDYKAANNTITKVQDAINKVSTQRSALGALQNRLEHTVANLDNVSENTSSAESRIRDTDMAEEMVNYSKYNILAQAGQSMLAQANQSTQGVLSLLQ